MEKIVISFLRKMAQLKKRDQVIDVFATLAEARSILVFMPDKLQDFGVARKFIENLMADFSNARFQFFMRESYRSLLNGDHKFGTIFVTDRDVNFWGLPKKQLRQKITATAYDIAIDLNDEFHLPSTYLCFKSRASLKICFDHEKREPFYNFYFRARETANLSSKYKKLIQYLKSDITSAPVSE